MTFGKVTPATKLVNEKKLSQAQMTPWHVPSSIWVHLGPRGSIFLVKNQFSHIFPASAWSPFLSVILTDKLARLAPGPNCPGPNLPLFRGGQLGPGQLGPGAQLSGAQFAIF